MNQAPQTLLALHATMLHGLRAVVTTDNQVHDHRIDDCYAPGVWTPYITEHAERRPGPQLVLSPSDPWPPHLKCALEDLGIPIRWVSTDYERSAYLSIRKWTLGRRLYRARFLAFLYQWNRTSCLHGHRAALNWERYLALETINALDEEESQNF